MSLIIAYIGKKGCVMAGDKRKIAYFGNKDEITSLESQLYDGTIATDEELYSIAAENNVNIKITEDATKISIVGDTVRGEVSSKGAFETKRKRIYGTTNGYQMVELIGSEITKRDYGEKAIILFGNKFSKLEAQRLINQKWKATQSLKFMGDVFVEILEEISRKTPTIGNSFDVLIKQPDLTIKRSQEYLNHIINQDVKVLNKFREKLREDLFQQNKEIELANKIINEGEIGNVVAIEDNILKIKLNSTTQAFNYNWKQLAAPGGEVVMFTESENVKIGDNVVIANEKLQLEKDNSSLTCDIILCSL